jgi:hypothetical protein
MDRSFATGDFKPTKKKGFAIISLGIIYHSIALSQPLSRDTAPLRRTTDARSENEFYRYLLITGSDSEPEPHWIRNRWPPRIRILVPNADPDPGRLKRAKMEAKNNQKTDN